MLKNVLVNLLASLKKTVFLESVIVKAARSKPVLRFLRKQYGMENESILKRVHSLVLNIAINKFHRFLAGDIWAETTWSSMVSNSDKNYKEK